MGASNTKFPVEDWTPLPTFNCFVLFLGERDKMKTEYIPKLSFLNTRKDTFNRILSEACEYKI